MSDLATKNTKLTLASANPTEQRILDYLNQNASDVLAEKINAGTKTLGGAVKYAKGEARKMDTGAECVCVDDATVFGWIVHFFEEDDIAEPKKEKAAVKLPGGVKAKPKDKAGKMPAVSGRNPEAKPEKPAEPEKPKGPIILELFSMDQIQGAKR